MSPVGNLTIQCITILNGIVGPGLAGELREINSVVEKFAATPNPPVTNIVLSNNLKYGYYNLKFH